MVNYNNGKIYSLRSHKTDLIYIGSTVQPLYKRHQEHKSAYNNYLKNGKKKYSSIEIYKLDNNPYIELICVHPCKSKQELGKEEGKWIRKMKCVNKQITGRTHKEYLNDNKEYFKQKNKEYVEKNKEQIKEYKTQYRKDNIEKIKEKQKEKILCECGIYINKSCKSRHEKTIKHKNNI